MASQRSKNQEDVEEPNEDGLLETELAQLQLRYRVMQNSFHAYKEEAKRKISKQKVLITSLDKDNVEFETDLGKLETAQNKAKDEENVQRLKHLSHLEKVYQTWTKEEKAKIKDINNKIAQMDQKIAEQRKKMGGTNNTTTTYHSAKKRITVLENRLDKATTHFNKQLATNASLRGEIDHLRQERAVFDNLYKKLAHELDKTKRETFEVIRDSTEAFEQRDDARNKMMALIERSEKDKEQHELELRDLQRMIHHDNRIREFMGIKASNRTELKAEEAAKKQKTDAEKQTNADQVTIAEYEAAQDQLRKITNEEDIDIIIETFKRNEQENFALFNYVNELNNEMEVCNEQLASLKKERDQFKAESMEVDEAHRKLVLQMEEKVDNLRKTTEIEHEKLKRVGKDLDELMDILHGLFTRIGCDPKPILDMLGGDSGIRPKNVMMYMGQIEQRTIEMLNALAYARRQRALLEGDIPPKPEPPPETSIIPVVPPSLKTESLDIIGEEEEQEEHPLTREELRQLVLRRLKTNPAAEDSQPVVPVATPRDKKKKTK